MKNIFLTLSFIFSLSVNSQEVICLQDAPCELVINGNFEEFVGTPPSNLSQINNFCGWLSANHLTTPDAFHRDTTNPFVGIPANNAGIEDDLNGDGYVGIINREATINREEWYERIYSELANPIQPNTEYIFSLEASLAEKYGQSSPIFVYFTNDLNDIVNHQNLQAGNFINVTNPNMLFYLGIPNTWNGWENLSVTFNTSGLTTGGETFMIIGNIMRAPLGPSYTTGFQQPFFLQNYTYLDNISLRVNTPTLSYDQAVFCKSDNDPTPTSFSPQGGIFSGPIGLSIDSSTGEIDLSNTTVGKYTVTYTTLNGGACPKFVDFDIEITESVFLEWSTFWGGSGTQELMYGDNDLDGNIYVAGHTFDDLNGEITSFISGRTAFVSKFAPDQTPLWSVPITDNAGNILKGVVCKIKNGKSSTFMYVAGSTNDHKAFISKIDQTNGDRIWTEVVAINGGISAEGLAVNDATGDVYISGTLSSSTDSNPLSAYNTTNSEPIYITPYQTAYCIKFRELGNNVNSEWSTYLSTDANSYSWGIDLKKNKNPVVLAYGAGTGLLTSVDSTGYANGIVPGAVVDSKSPWIGDQDIFVTELNRNKGTINDYTFYRDTNTDNTTEQAYDLIIDGNDNILVAGHSDLNGLLLSFDSQLDFRYAQKYNDVSLFHALDKNSDNNIFVKGFGYGTPTSGAFGNYTSTPPGNPIENQDAIVYHLGYNSGASPNVLWSTEFGGSGHEYGSVLTYYEPSKSLYVGGRTHTTNANYFDLLNPIQDENKGSTEGFLAKFSFSCIPSITAPGLARISTESIFKSMNYEKEQILVYPNPSKGNFEILIKEYDEINKPYAEVHNYFGLRILTLDSMKKKERIDLSSQSKGVYFIKIQNGEDLIIKRVVIE